MAIQLDPALAFLPLSLRREMTDVNPLYEVVMRLNRELLERAERLVRKDTEIKSLIRERGVLQSNNVVLMNALWKACGDDEATVNDYINSQGEMQ